MRHLSLKDLASLCYVDSDTQVNSKLVHHLRVCPKCLREYQKLKILLSDLTIKLPQIKEEEVEKLIERVKERTLEPNFLERVKYRWDYLIVHLRWRLAPQLLIATVAVILALIILPWWRSYNLNREFNILQLEAELSLEDLNNISPFDFWEDTINSDNFLPSTPQNNFGQAHKET
ncbi:MAG: hypothetical protein J7K71_00595 [Candidatus Omnitrophica bacterium]|nr:hypothetical protein [Candidatus Omnitrophota bacterium]